MVSSFVVVTFMALIDVCIAGREEVFSITK